MWILLSGDTLEEPHREKKTNKTKHSTRVKFLKSAASVLGRKTVGWFYEYHVLFWFSPQSEFEFEEKLFHSCLASGCAFWEFVKCSPTGCFLLIQKKKKKKGTLDFMGIGWNCVSAHKHSPKKLACLSVGEVLFEVDVHSCTHNNKYNFHFEREFHFLLSHLPTDLPLFRADKHRQLPELSDCCCTWVFILQSRPLLASF